MRAYPYVISGTLLGALFAVLMWNLIASGIDRDKRVAESWREFDRRLINAGCKITDYMPASGNWVRPMWTCPDGHVEIGRPQ